VEEIQEYVDKNINMLKEFIGDVVKKLPMPVRFDASGIALRSMKLHFSCGLKHNRCKFPDNGIENSCYVTTTYDIAKWLKIGLQVVKLGIAVFEKSPKNAFAAVQNIYNVVKKNEDQDFLAFISQPFLTSTEQDHLIQQLRKDRFFEVFTYYPKNGTWCCLRCIEEPAPHNIIEHKEKEPVPQAESSKKEKATDQTTGSSETKEDEKAKHKDIVEIAVTNSVSSEGSSQTKKDETSNRQRI